MNKFLLFLLLLTHLSNVRQIACWGFAISILLTRLAFQAMVSFVRNAAEMWQLRSGFASLALFVSYLPIGLMLCSCSLRHTGQQDITSMQIIDRNGFSETISNKERLALYKNTDFLAPQPYEKVLRVLGKDTSGKSHSHITTYHPNSQLHQSLQVVDGRAHGDYREWHPNGKLRLEVFVIDGIADVHEQALATWIFDGLSTVWNEEGAVIAKIQYEKGVLHGSSLYYHPNGALAKQALYIKGALQGTYETYDEQGLRLETKNYHQGLLEGHAEGVGFTEEYEKGLLLSGRYNTPDGTLISEVRDGNGIKTVFEKGILSRTLTYVKGVVEGKIECYDAKGKLASLYHVHEGKKNGQELLYFPGTLQPNLSLEWHDDVLQGTIKTWYPNGTLESQREFSGAKKQGSSFAWYQNGQLMLMEEYENDQLVKGAYYKKGDKHPVSKVESGKGTATLFDAKGFFLNKVVYNHGKPSEE